MRKALIITAVLIVLGVVAAPCAVRIGPAFDKAFVKGRVSQEQADAINAILWNHSPSYCSPETAGWDKTRGEPNGRGRSFCRVVAGDRVLNSSVSEFMRGVFRDDH